MIFKIKLLLIFAGGMLCFWGYQDYAVSSKASTPAEKVELSQLESQLKSSTELANNFIRIGGHWAIFPASIYQYQVDGVDADNPSRDATVNYTYYPIISKNHPYLVQTDELFERYQDEASIPEDQWPQLDQFAVLVKTKRYKMIGTIPQEWKDAEFMQGVVINRIESLSSEEEELLRQSFPHIDLEKVLIVEEGREPSSILKAIGFLLGGLVLILVGLAWLFKKS